MSFDLQFFTDIYKTGICFTIILKTIIFSMAE